MACLFKQEMFSLLSYPVQEESSVCFDSGTGKHFLWKYGIQGGLSCRSLHPSCTCGSSGLQTLPCWGAWRCCLVLKQILRIIVLFLLFLMWGNTKQNAKRKIVMSWFIIMCPVRDFFFFYMVTCNYKLFSGNYWMMNHHYKWLICSH